MRRRTTRGLALEAIREGASNSCPFCRDKPNRMTCVGCRVNDEFGHCGTFYAEATDNELRMGEDLSKNVEWCEFRYQMLLHMLEVKE